MSLWDAIRVNFLPFKEIFGSPTDPRVITALVLKGFISILGILFLCYTVYAGFVWMTAGGNEAKILRAKSTLATGVIGMVVIFSAFSIAQFFVTTIGCATADAGEWCLFFNNLTW